MAEYIYIAGAASRARTTKEYLEYLNPEIRTIAYLVSPEMTDNEDSVDGVPVIKIQAGADVDTACKVYLGTRGVNQGKLAGELRDIGFSEELIIPVSVELDTKLRNEYVKRKFADAGKSFVKFNEHSRRNVNSETRGHLSVSIYMASSAFDGKLSDPYVPLAEEKILLVGTALTDKRLGDDGICDNTGDNISDKNKQFCELTGLYWIWKNTSEDIVGLVHYRRHFLLPENWTEIFASNEVDVILPIPLYVAPSVEENYRQRHVSSDWDNMLDYLKEHYPEDYAPACVFFKNGLYSPCNMLIARKHVLDELCKWMFPILFAIADKGGVRDDAYQNRYPGFVSERLITYFFESRRDRYKVVYADKNFLA